MFTANNSWKKSERISVSVKLNGHGQSQKQTKDATSQKVFNVGEGAGYKIEFSISVKNAINYFN